MPRRVNNPRTVSRLKTAETERLLKFGRAQGRSLARQMRTNALRLIDRGMSPTPAIVQAFDQLANVASPNSLVPHMTRTHLQALARERVIAATGDLVALPATPHAQAIKFLQNRMNLSAQQITQLGDSYHRHLLNVAGESSAFVSQRVNEAIIDSTRQGLHLRGATANVRNAFEKAGVNLGTNSPHIFETIARTNTQLAYAAGSQNARKDPAIDEILWGYEYVTVGDTEVRPEHAALHGFRAPKDHPIWDTMMPPNGWNCRCTVVMIFVGDESAVTSLPDDVLTVDVGDGETVTITPGPDKGFEFNPGQLFDAIATPALSIG